MGTQRKESPPLKAPDGGTKRECKEVASTEDESDSGVVRIGTGSVVNSLYSKNRKKLKDEDNSIV